MSNVRESDYARLRTGKTDKICPTCKEIMFMNFGKLYCRSCYSKDHATGRQGQNSMVLISEHALSKNLGQKRLFSLLYPYQNYIVYIFD